MIAFLYSNLLFPLAQLLLHLHIWHSFLHLDSKGDPFLVGFKCFIPGRIKIMKTMILFYFYMISIPFVFSLALVRKSIQAFLVLFYLKIVVCSRNSNLRINKNVRTDKEYSVFFTPVKK